MIVTLDDAASLLNAGQVVAVPTETVYGLAASIHHPKAIAHIFKLKNRPIDNPLIVHISSAKDLEVYAKDIPQSALALAKAFWPGPLTIILKANTELVNDTIRANLPTAAFRIPQHHKALELLKLTGPLVMPSANISGYPSATTSKHVAHDFGESLPILEGGACTQGVESTILLLNENHWEVARLGAIPPEAFEKVLGYIPKVHVTQGSKEKPLCPGQMYRHYSPKAELILAETIPANAHGVVVGFSDRKYPKECRVIDIGSSDEPEVVAANLYDVLRRLDKENIQSAFIDFDMPDTGLWMTIKERLHKAVSRD
jgi:L-threonylcarbamoyladenylate synthase